MKRKIKFRYRIKTSAILATDDPAYGHYDEIITKIYTLDEIMNGKINDDFKNEHVTYEILSIDMSTGVPSGENKDEIDIFEDDIVIKHIRSNKMIMLPFSVLWQKEIAGFNIHDKLNHWYEIIGNLHDSPNMIRDLNREYNKLHMTGEDYRKMKRKIKLKLIKEHQKDK